MSRTQNMKRAGFTLLELLVVMAILIALMALIIPGMMNRQTQSNIRQATIQINNLDNNLVLYSNDNRGFPTTEQGLMSLIYIPDNAGMGRSTLMSQQQQGQMGVPGADGTGGFGTGEAAMVGGDPTTMPMPGVDGGMPTMPGNTTGMPPNPGGMTGGLDPSGMTPGGMNDPTLGGGGGFGMTDPMNPGAATGGVAGGWTQPFYNPAIYTQVRKRPQPYVEKESDLTDPWGMPYRYENNLQFNGLNRTGTAKPAIWSAGPDKLDDTDDDIRNWDPVEAQQLIAARQQQMQGGGMGGMEGGSMMPDGTMPGGNMMPDGTMPGGTMPGGTMPGGTMPGGTMPGGTMPGGTMPGGTMPGGTMPGGTMPGGTMPGGTMPPAPTP